MPDTVFTPHVPVPRQLPVHRRPSATRTQTRSPSPFSSLPTVMQHSSPTPPPPQLHRRSSRDHVKVNHHSNGNGVALEKIGEDEVQPPSITNGHAVVADESKKIDWEIPRKTLHSSIGFLVVPLYTSHHPVHQVIFGLAITLVGVATADLIRFNSRGIERAYEAVLGFLMRESEKHKINGVVWYLVGVLFVLIALPLDIAVVSILTLSWADTTASTIGRAFGRRTRQLPTHITVPGTALKLPAFAPKKSVAGFSAAVVTGALITGVFYAFVAPLGVDHPSWQLGQGLLGSWPGLALLTAVGGLTAGVAEALYVGPLDDNLTLPILTGAALWTFFRLETLLASFF